MIFSDDEDYCDDDDEEEDNALWTDWHHQTFYSSDAFIPLLTGSLPPHFLRFSSNIFMYGSIGYPKSRFSSILYSFAFFSLLALYNVSSKSPHSS